MATFYYNGIGGTTGSELARMSPILVGAGTTKPYTGQIYYVHHTGSDSNTGLDRKTPFATLSKAVGKASDSGASAVVVQGGVVVVMSGHVEQIKSTATRIYLATSCIKIIGEGDGDDMPTFYAADDIGAVSNITLNSKVYNIKFGQNLAKVNPLASSVPKVTTSAGQTLFHGCVFEFGDYDGNPALGGVAIPNGISRINKCVFSNKKSSTTMTVPMLHYVTTVTAELDSCVIDGGNGMGSPAIAVATGATISDFTATNMTLLNGADIQVGDDPVRQNCFIHVKASSGSSTVLT